MLNKKRAVQIVIFGGNGDLTWRKLVPALYNLFIAGALPEKYCIICVDYVAMKETAFRKKLRNGIDQFSRTGKTKKKDWTNFESSIHYLAGDFNNPACFAALGKHLNAQQKTWKQRASRVFYFAVSPRFIETIADGLHTHAIAPVANLDRLVIEKPFGTDYQTAHSLNRFLLKRFAEKQLYRIDHYLGKETVQNILAFRFANSVFEPLWNKDHIDHIQISVSETVSIGKRGGYYDGSGAMKDMIQNHLMQLLCVTAMDCPHRYEAETIRDAKLQVLKKIRPFKNSNDLILGQYTAGNLQGVAQQAYRKEENIKRGSRTETFAALKLFIDNEKWKGVPFFLRTGKCLPRQSSTIIIQFKKSKHPIFSDDITPNQLVISVQPEQEISLLFESKVPGLQMKLKAVEMDFTYKDSYTEPIPEAYEALLLDVMEGDATLFMRADQVEQAWKIMTPLLDAIKSGKHKLHFYKAGSWGPQASRDLLKPFATNWFSLPDPAIK